MKGREGRARPNAARTREAQDEATDALESDPEIADIPLRTMKRLLSTMGGPELGLLKSRLEEAGIGCDLRDEQTSQTIHSAAFPAELWILDDGDYAEAVALSKAWQGAPSEAREDWICSGCGEGLGGQFVACWKCGALRRDAG